MTRIDFYVLPGAAVRDRQLTACRLAEKAYRLGHRVFVRTGSAQEEAMLDDLLWTFKQNSFVPHSRWPGAQEVPSPVLVGHIEAPETFSDVLVNLSESIPADYERFARVVEIVDDDEHCREAGRRRYRFYRDRGYAPATHRLSSSRDPS
jgi:DNA polymerase-3 subunit chi